MSLECGHYPVPKDVLAMDAINTRPLYSFPHITDELSSSPDFRPGTTETKPSTTENTEEHSTEASESLLLKVIPVGITDGFMAMLYSATLEVFGYKCNGLIELGMLKYAFPDRYFFTINSDCIDIGDQCIKSEMIKFIQKFLGKTCGVNIEDAKRFDCFILTDAKFSKEGYKKGWELGKNLNVYVKGKKYSMFDLKSCSLINEKNEKKLTLYILDKYGE